MIERLRVAAFQALHPEREVRLRSLHQEVVVVGHEAVSEILPASPVSDVPADREEPLAVAFVANDPLLPVAAGRDVVDASGNEYARRTSHAPIFALRTPAAASRV
jgi:hypothetical protein